MRAPPANPRAYQSPPIAEESRSAGFGIKDNIGDVRMLQDGTLVCRYRAEYHDKDGKLTGIGEGQIIYKVDDSYYKTVLAFMGGMKPGDIKPMPRVGPLEESPDSARTQPKATPSK